MINKKDNFEAWVQLVEEIEEAKEHLGSLAENMASSDSFDEVEFRAQIHHVFTHLSRTWNARNSAKGINAEDWNAISRLPADLDSDA